MTERKKYVNIKIRKEGFSGMDVSAIIQAIGTVGFPIVCCGAMMWYVRYITDSNREEIMRVTEQHKQEISEVTQALNNNTLVIQKLCDRLDEKDVM